MTYFDDIVQQNQQCPHQSKMSNSTSPNHCSRQKLENFTFNYTHAFVDNHIGSHIGNHHQDTCYSNCNKPIYRDILKIIKRWRFLRSLSGFEKRICHKAF